MNLQEIRSKTELEIPTGNTLKDRIGNTESNREFTRGANTHAGYFVGSKTIVQ